MGVDALAIGTGTVASGSDSLAQGRNTVASGLGAVAEGAATTAGGSWSHAEGNLTIASAYASHAEGLNNTASGVVSHVEGAGCLAGGNHSHAANYRTIAGNFAQTAIGRNNLPSDPGLNQTQLDDAFIIGNGSIANRSNAFRVQFTGDVHSASGVYTTGGNYAEMFEWQDGNPANEDRIGYFVTLDGKYIRKATAADQYILGVVSAEPAVVGNSQSGGWQGMYLRDRWGRIIYEWVDEQRELYDLDPQTENMQKRIETVRVQQPMLNPEYDAGRTYQPRTARPEWAAVGLIGKVRVRDNGSCQPNGFCQPNADGIAVSGGQGYRVLERLDEETILICI